MFVFRLVASRGGCDRRERLSQHRVYLFVLGDFEARVEGLVCEPAIAVVGVRVGAVSIGKQPWRVMEERAASVVLFVVLGEAMVDVGAMIRTCGWPSAG